MTTLLERPTPSRKRRKCTKCSVRARLRISMQSSTTPATTTVLCADHALAMVTENLGCVMNPPYVKIHLIPLEK